jgi:hypothetical protein
MQQVMLRQKQGEVVLDQVDYLVSRRDAARIIIMVRVRVMMMVMMMMMVVVIIIIIIMMRVKVMRRLVHTVDSNGDNGMQAHPESSLIDHSWHTPLQAQSKRWSHSFSVKLLLLS